MADMVDVWTLYVCDECGDGFVELQATDADAATCADGHPPRDMRRVEVVPKSRADELETALGACLVAAHGNDAANNAVKRIVRDAMVKKGDE